MVSSEDLREIFLKYIEVKEYYNLIVCCDRMADREFDSKHDLKIFLDDFWDYIDELIYDDLVDEIWGYIDGG